MIGWNEMESSSGLCSRLDNNQLASVTALFSKRIHLGVWSLLLSSIALG